MNHIVTLTDIGDGITSGVITAILPKIGDSISEGDTLMELETDKAVIPFPAPTNGTLTKLLVNEGDEVKVGVQLAVIEAAAGSAPAAKQPTEQPSTKTNTAAPIQAPVPPPAAKTSPAPAPAAPTAATNETRDAEPAGFIAASPATRKLARELGVQLSNVRGSGRNARVTMEDLKIHVKSALGSAPSGAGINTMPATAPLPNFSEFGTVEIKPISRLRKTIAANMQTAWSSIPHVHHHSKFELSTISALQKQAHAAFKEKGSTFSVTPVLIKAMAQVLAEFPDFNSSYDAARGQLHVKQYYNIGVAVDTPAGLIVPVIRNVDSLSVFAIGKTLRELAAKTRERKVGLSDLKGACMTLSNLGGIGGEHFTPIINPPEVAILGVARTVEEVRMVNGVPVAVPMLPVTLGYDHRVIDGAVAARFLVRLKQLIEEPAMLLMNVET